MDKITTMLGKFSAVAKIDYDQRAKMAVWSVTIYDRDDTSIVYSQDHDICKDYVIVTRMREIIRSLSASQVANGDAVDGEPPVVGVVYEADVHCLYCARDEHGRDAIARVMATHVDNENVVELIDDGYPIDAEHNPLTRYTVVEAWENYYRSANLMPHCGDCCIALLDKHEAYDD